MKTTEAWTISYNYFSNKSAPPNIVLVRRDARSKMPRLPLQLGPATPSPAPFTTLAARFSNPPFVTVPKTRIFFQDSSRPTVKRNGFNGVDGYPARSFFSTATATSLSPRLTSLLTSTITTTTTSIRGYCTTPQQEQEKEIKEWPYLYRAFDKMPHLEPFFKQVDAEQDAFIERLREAVAIPSISSEDARRPDVVKVRYIPSPAFKAYPF